jgi:hypothetical protein
VPAVRIVPVSSRRASIGTRERRKADSEALAAAPPYPCRRSLLYTFPPYFCASRGSRRPLSRRAGPRCGQGVARTARTTARSTGALSVSAAAATATPTALSSSTSDLFSPEVSVTTILSKIFDSLQPKKS